MGLKKGRELFSQKSAVSTTLKKLRERIIKEKGADSNYRVQIAIDGEVWARQSLSNPHKDSKVSGEYHSEPKVPVVSVSTSVVMKLKLLRGQGFDPILVLDGANHPLKDDEHGIRYEKKGETMKDCLIKLQDAYANPDKYTYDQVSELRKALIRPREDITYEIALKAKRSKFTVMCAPFESDHQFVALQNQKIIDCVWSIDTDILGLGIREVIKTLPKDGGIRVMSYDQLTTKTLPKLFGRPDISVTQSELRLFCCMLGNDYLPKGKKNDGVVACTNKMLDYLSKTTDQERQQWITDYKLAHETPEKFAKAIFAWQHASAYLVVSNDPDVSPRDALKSGEYTVVLGSMTAESSQRDEEFYAPDESNPKLGYIPHQRLRLKHSYDDESTIPTHREFFELEKYARTGKPLKRLDKQINQGGHEVTPGAIISFDKQPMKFIPTRKLELWLSCRGLGTTDMNRSEMMVMVQRLLDHRIDALPLFVMRGGGAYIAKSILEFENEELVDWKSGAEALEEIRGEKCACIDGIDFMVEAFSLAHNSKRIRCLKHLKSGSFDLLDIKVSSNLRSRLTPETEFFVLDFTCAPSQKGLGTEGKVYSMTLVFGKVNDCWTLMDTPYSLCGCPVGVFKICAHKGGGLLLLYAIRNCFAELSFSDLCKRMPPNIHSVAWQLQMIHHVYPAPYSREYRIERKIKKEARDSDEDSPTSNDGDEEPNDIELEEQNDREMENEEKCVPLIDVCGDVSKWCREIEVSIDTKGFAHRYNPEKTIEACVKAAKPESDSKYLFRQHVRFVNQEKSVSNSLAPKTLYGYFCREYVSNMNVDENTEYISNRTLLRSQTESAYNGIYASFEDNEAEESDESIVVVNLDGEDSDEDSDYYISDDSEDEIIIAT